MRQTAAELRDHLADAEFRSCTGKGEQLDGAQVIDFALDAITRAAAQHDIPEGIRDAPDAFGDARQGGNPG